ncbi:MFS transporter|uniref:Predicted arabinose efflux permease, MFS family n=1 Tax=Dendrosporobacter quercicolus TaxID=146817 RepID=A0A1G9MB89_9FIRM|nr:MFS transporter [Dendrosporobacter quercicolus]NSL46976.1 MFS transporter [Dendrosporobacter quercicolus DSM 1736]SDL71251.1 Predicted arabinose efflux permease, MFS family [Dendrosporobacter quercicolus]
MSTHRQLIVLSFSAFVLMLGDGMVLALLPQTVISLSNTVSFVWYLAATYAFAQVVAQLPIGLLADRHGNKPFLFMGYVLSVVAGLLFFFTTNVNLIFLGRILQGIGEAPILGLAPAALSIRYAGHKGKAIGVYNASIYLGMTTGPLLRMTLFQKWSDKQIFLLYAVLCALGVILISCFMENIRKPHKQNTRSQTVALKNFFVLMKSPQILVVCLGITLYGAGFGIFMTIIPAFLLTEQKYDQSYINAFFSLFYIAISTAQIIIGWLSDRLGREIFMVTGMLIASFGLLLFLNYEYFTLILVLCFSSFGLGTYYLSSMAFLNEKVTENHKGTISAIFYLLWGLGMFWGPLLLTNYIQNTNYLLGFSLFSQILLLQAVLLIISKLYYKNNNPINNSFHT